MRLEKVFRLSTYLSVAMATLCLGVAEESLLPGMMLFLIPIGILLFVGYKVEGRWALAPGASNVAAMAIVVGTGVWIAYNLLTPPGDWLQHAPWPAALLPFGGPILMLLLLAKVFRPKKDKDFWALHLIGLMEVALACILADEVIFALLFVVYLGGMCWSLMVFHQWRETQKDRRSSSAPAGTEPQSNSQRMRRLPWALLGIGSAGWRTVMVTVAALTIFVVTPRLSTSNWHFSPSFGPIQARTGFADQVDINRAESLQVSRKVVFEVKVTNANGQPYTEVVPTQHWRGTTIDTYHLGRWNSRLESGSESEYKSRLTDGDRTDLTPMGHRALYYTFTLDPSEAGGLFLADPAVIPLDDPHPWVVAAAQFANGRDAPVVHGRDATLIGPRPEPLKGSLTYTQVSRPLVGGEVLPVLDMDANYKNTLLRQPVREVYHFTRDVLVGMINTGWLTPADLEMALDPDVPVEVPFRVLAPEKRIKVSNVLCTFLNTLGGYTYSLESKRVDLGMDPTEDFLRNAKQGKCEQFASGLILMLRSAGIPCRMVSGFRGAEHVGQGVYQVREADAHTWVEVLVGRRTVQGKLEQFWMSQDPTPTEDAIHALGSDSWANWWYTVRTYLRVFWKEGIVDASPDFFQTRAMPLIAEFETTKRMEFGMVAIRNGNLAEGLEQLAMPLMWLSLAVCAVMGWKLRHWVFGKRRRVSPLHRVPFYDHFLAVVARQRGLKPSSWQTPREFGALVAQSLHSNNGDSTTDLPNNVIEAFYRVRYGGRALDRTEEADLYDQINRLGLALASKSL